MRGRSFIEPKSNDRVHICFEDKDIVPLLIEYGRRKNLNISEVIKKLCTTKDDITGLINDLEREKYELLDEDQKIDKILELEKKLKEATNNA